MANVNIAVLFKNRFKHKKCKELICKKCHAKIAEIVTYKQPGDNNIPQDGLPCVTRPHTAIHNDQNTPSEPPTWKLVKMQQILTTKSRLMSNLGCKVQQIV